jgi:hypothetical protein
MLSTSSASTPAAWLASIHPLSILTMLRKPDSTPGESIDRERHFNGTQNVLALRVLTALPVLGKRDSNSLPLNSVRAGEGVCCGGDSGGRVVGMGGDIVHQWEGKVGVYTWGRRPRKRDSHIPVSGFSNIMGEFVFLLSVWHFSVFSVGSFEFSPP